MSQRLDAAGRYFYNRLHEECAKTALAVCMMPCDLWAKPKRPPPAIIVVERLPSSSETNFLFLFTTYLDLFLVVSAP